MVVDVLVVGAGPAGMSATIELEARGISTTVVDDQPSAGGRIFAAIEARELHGAEDERGLALAKKFRENCQHYLNGTEVWQIEPGPRVFLSKGGRARAIEPRFILMASGAQERPMPFEGWQLPGVMTVGAAQILLKTARQVPDRPVVLAGTGPLMLLYAHQLLGAGGAISAILDTTPRGRIRAGAGLLPGAVAYGWQDLLRGARWLAELRSIPVIRQVIGLTATGDGRLSAIAYTTASGETGELPTDLLFVHDGVIPAVHGTLAAGCDHRWNIVQQCLEPVTGTFGASSVPHIFIAGDGATIGGARAAELSGRLAAIGIALAAGRISAIDAETASRPLRRALAAARRFRRFIDTMYPPSRLRIADAALACRCEEVSAGAIRQVLAGRPTLGADGVKIETRACMGPCQGRQCALTVAGLVAEVAERDQSAADFPRIRPPLKPLTLGELASLEEVE